jgi:hypothetical protein
MTAFDQQVLKALNDIAGEVGSLRAQMTASWLERWGSLLGVAASVLVALVGWWFIARENRRSNRDAFRLQLADAARNRILDSLYEYRGFLEDVQSPKRILQQDVSILEGMNSRMRSPVPLDSAPAYLELEQQLRQLAQFDHRQFDCFRVMQRDGWALDIRAQNRVESALGELENTHERIMSSYVEYVGEALDALDNGLEAGIDFVYANREATATAAIDGQILLVNTTAVSLQRPLE